ncbi:MAG: Nif3-like dinuclear metal center hexameric protein [Clostridia bacterium]|nr:Nif3-like dinuclear metal center hexameric protein [Clostridia bacterium]
MASIKEVCALIEEIIPLKYSKEMVSELGYYDNSGLLVAPTLRHVSRVLCALDAGNAVIEEAKALGCEMILTHHPAVYSGQKSLSVEMHPASVVIRAIQEGLYIYSSHLSMDACPNGINETIAKRLGILQAKPQEVTSSGGGCFYVGELEKELTLQEYAAFVKNTLKTDWCHFGGDPSAKVKRVGIVNGGGGSLDCVQQALRYGCDTYISGDMRHESFIFAREVGLSVIATDHYAQERFYVEELAHRLDGKNGVRFFVSQSERAPFTVI